MADAIRTVKSNGQRMICVEYLTDRRLSWRAKGVLSAILAFSGEYTIGEIICLASGGKPDIDIGAGFAELEKYGYLKKSLNGSEISYTFYEKPVKQKDSQHSDPEAEIPYAEDVPGKTLAPEYSGEEEQLRLREKLNMKIVAEKCSENFVELVFRELCRRDADFRQIMTAKAFESVCLIAWERKSREAIPGSYEFSVLINRYFDSVVFGIRSAGGNMKAERQGAREYMDAKKL